MTNDKIYRKLKYFFDNKIPVHLKNWSNVFFNGDIVDLDKENESMVLSERIKGVIPILFEEINPDSIFKFTREGE